MLIANWIVNFGDGALFGTFGFESLLDWLTFFAFAYFYGPLIRFTFDMLSPGVLVSVQ